MLCNYQVKGRWILGALLALAASPAVPEEEIIVSRTLAGQLRVAADFPQPFQLPASIFPGIAGYATGEMGVHSTVLDDPGTDSYQLSTAANLRLILLAKDPGLEVWNDTGSGYLGIGQSFYIGESPFDTHPVWNIVAGVPGQAYTLTLKLHDLNGVYPDSAPFVLSFTPEANPGPFRLTLTSATPLQVTLTWPTNALGWGLQSTELLSTGTWSAVTNLPSLAGTNFSLTLPPAPGWQFFRLQRP